MADNDLRPSDQPAAPKADPQPEGVGEAGGSPQGVPTQEERDTVDRSELERLQREHERNIARLQSTLDRNYSQQLAEREAELERARHELHQTTLQSLDEDDRAAYERRYLEEENERLRGTAEQYAAQAQAATAMGQIAQYYISLGVAPDDLDFSSIDSLYETGSLSLASLVSDMRNELERSRQQTTGLQAPAGQQQPQQPAQAAPQKQAPEATPVLTQHGATPTPATLFDIQQSLGERLGRTVTFEEMMKMAERNPGIRNRINEYITAQEAARQE